MDLALAVWMCVGVCLFVCLAGNKTWFGLFTHTRHTEMSIESFVGVSRAVRVMGFRVVSEFWFISETESSRVGVFRSVGRV